MWWWSKRRKLEKNREETLSAITGERSIFEAMMERAQINSVAIPGFATRVLSRLTTYESEAKVATTETELDALTDDAERQGQLRAYLCPDSEVAEKGLLQIDLMEEWGVPREQITTLRKTVEQKLTGPDANAARGALRNVFEEFDSWSDYTDDYSRTMFRSTIALLAAIAAFSALAIALFHSPYGVLWGVLIAGAAGGCASVIVWVPRLSVTPSSKFDEYKRRIFGRIGIAIATSLIGTAFVAWGLVPITIQRQSLADVLNACTEVPNISCTELRILILLGVSMVLGFSERALSRLEEQFVGKR